MNREQWTDWGLLNVPGLPDFVYKTLPTMGDFCIEELETGLSIVRIQKNNVLSKLGTDGLEEVRKSKLENVLRNELLPQEELIEQTIESVKRSEKEDRFDLPVIVEALLVVVDENSTRQDLEGELTILESYLEQNGRDLGAATARSIKRRWCTPQVSAN